MRDFLDMFAVGPSWRVGEMSKRGGVANERMFWIVSPARSSIAGIFFVSKRISPQSCRKGLFTDTLEDLARI